MAIKVKLEKDGFIKDGFVGYSYTSAIFDFWVPAFRLDFNAFVFFFGLYMLEKFLSEFYTIYSILNYYSIENFLGVDFSSSPLEIDKRRSPNSYNMTNKNGYLETRNGYELIYKLGERINGIWNIDLIDKELNIVHSGNSLYQFSDNFKSSKKILTNLNDNLSTGIYLGGYLVIFDGKRTIIYHNTENGYKAEYVDEKGYIITSEEPYGMTSREGVFAGGDVVHKPATVVLAMREAKKAVDGMVKYMEIKRAMAIAEEHK